MNHINIGSAGITADAIKFSYFSFMENQIYGIYNIIHVCPIPHLLSLSIDRNVLFVNQSVNSQRHELFRELVWSNSISTRHAYCRKPVCLKICLSEHNLCRFGNTVRAMRIKWGRFVERFVMFIEGTENFICSHIEKHMPFRFILPCFFCHVHQI